MRTGAACAAVVVMLMVGGGLRTVPVAAQQQNPGAPPSSQGISVPTRPSSHMPDMATSDAAPDPMRAEMREKMIRTANEQRHKKMLDDANKMVQLANELKADVEKAQNDELSVGVLKKAAEVEKLAHDVQQRMKQP
jgi:hypothetical protein